MRMYEVGGCVRDEILGVPSKDIDFVVVMEDIPWKKASGWYENVTPFDRMISALESQGYELFRDNNGKIVGSEYFTARGRFPKWHPTFANAAADFVLARKEGDYSDGRHPDTVEAGTLLDDLNRRDFTMNAIAKDPITGDYFDPHNGQRDIRRKIIKAVGDPLERLTEDPLRALRAIRFAVTKGFGLDHNLEAAMREESVIYGVAESVSDERIADELSKMFQFNSTRALFLMAEFKPLTAAVFQGRVSLDSTLKTKGRK
jgi:tRNA nucleotidyltransferase/poly(A) polymerase